MFPRPPDFAPACRKCGGMAPFGAGMYGLCDRCRREEEREREKEKLDKKWRKEP